MEWVYITTSHYWTLIVSFLSFDPELLKEPEMMFRIGLQIFLLFGSAFFSGSETALFSLSRLDLQQLRRERNRHSEQLHELLDQPRRLIISILCGNELINIAAAANMAGILMVLYGETNAGWINIFVMVPLILLFGEVTPKTIAVSNPIRFSTKLVAGPMSLWVRLISPLRQLIRIVADRVTSYIVGEEKNKENILQVDEFRSLVEDVTKEGELNATERALIYNLLEAGDTEIVEIMTPRTKISYINYKWPAELMIKKFRQYRHPRVPVYRGQHDKIVGFMHAEDVLNIIMKKKDLNLIKRKDLIRPPVVAPLTKKVDEMFDFFQSNNARAAIVLNEFGGVEGLITVRDVLNFIFGQVSDDSSGSDLYQMDDENYYDVPGDMKLTDFDNLSNFGIEDPRMTTVGGYAFRYLDHLPKIGDKVNINDITIVVLAMDKLRIDQVRVIKGAPEQYLKDLPLHCKIKKSARRPKGDSISLPKQSTDEEITTLTTTSSISTSNNNNDNILKIQESNEPDNIEDPRSKSIASISENNSDASSDNSSDNSSDSSETVDIVSTISIQNDEMDTLKKHVSDENLVDENVVYENVVDEKPVDIKADVENIESDLEKAEVSQLKNKDDLNDEQVNIDTDPTSNNLIKTASDDSVQEAIEDTTETLNIDRKILNPDEQVILEEAEGDTQQASGSEMTDMQNVEEKS